MFVHGRVVLVILSVLLCNFQLNGAVDDKSASKAERWVARNNTSPADDHYHSPHMTAFDSYGGTHAADIVAQWRDLERLSAKLAVHAIFDNILPTIDKLFDENNVSISCQSSVYKVLQDAAVLKKYAVQSKPHFCRRFLDCDSPS